MKGWQLFLFAVAVWVSYRIGLHYGQKCPVIAPIEKVDTLVIRDTIVSYKPQYVDRVILDTLLLPADTLRIRDTLYVAVQREQVIWQDSLARVYASGVMPQVDSVHHFIRKEVVTEIRTISVPSRKRWGVGVQVGYGGCIQNGQVFTSPYVGVGVSYNLFSW